MIGYNVIILFGCVSVVHHFLILHFKGQFAFRIEKHGTMKAPNGVLMRKCMFCFNKRQDKMSRGLIKRAIIPSAYYFTEDRFLEKYVKCFEDQAPQLPKLYEEKMNLAATG
ncbi:hypothetical protein RIF29_08081 [Crotalaria pallida]|uniref:Uncharacterized protein n=1 Tax=Crotalaria pallida TaxID=3830 RepID=A0AAN9J6K5_CROPI